MYIKSVAIIQPSLVDVHNEFANQRNTDFICGPHLPATILRTMNSNQSLEILVVGILYICIFVMIVGPALESFTGLETLSTDATGGFERTWNLVSNPQGWFLCLGYVPVHYTYLFVRARLAGESINSYWE